MQDQPRIRVIELFFLLILVALTFGFYMVMRPFLINIFLAAVFTSVLFPLQARVSHRLGDRSVLASALIVLAVLVGVAIPVVIIGALVYTEAVDGYRTLVDNLPAITEQVRQLAFLERLEPLPLIGDYVQSLKEIDIADEFGSAISSASRVLLQVTQRGLLTLGSTILNFLVVLLLMFFFFAKGPQLLNYIYSIVPMPNAEIAQIAEETRKVTAATLISTIIIGLIEGSLGVILFSVFGLPSPFLWGLVIVVVSMIPLIGTNLVLVPAGITLLMSGRVVAGILVILAGIGGVATTQNVIKPKLLGDRTGLHPALALLATIGGIAWLGIIGILVGPLLATLFIVIWQQFGIRYRDELSTRSAGAKTEPDPQAEA